MDLTDIEYADTRGLSESEVDELLADHHVGVLALADGGRPYAIPVDYRYDGDALWLRLSDDGESRKLAALETTDVPEFLVYGHGGPFESWSVVVTGTLVERDPGDVGVDAVTMNEWFGPLRTFEESIEEIEIRLFEFTVDRAVGRATIG